MNPPAGADQRDPERRADAHPAGGTGVKRHLVALATAGVLTLYAAGYARTDAAAKSLERDEGARRSGALTSAPAASLGGAPASAALAASAGVGGPPAPSATPAPEASGGATPLAPAATDVPVPGDPGPTGTAAATGEAAAAGPTRFKDGVYAGWGNSQHGKIEATVEIRAGRIVSARISTCKTRWPCARIALLVPQVAERQSQEVDVITGATHSSDAFYYALVEALSKAK
jgi:uncharacterized protein with FMN-binding domain